MLNLFFLLLFVTFLYGLAEFLKTTQNTSEVTKVVKCSKCSRYIPEENSFLDGESIFCKNKNCY